MVVAVFYNLISTDLRYFAIETFILLLSDNGFSNETIINPYYFFIQINDIQLMSFLNQQNSKITRRSTLL